MDKPDITEEYAEFLQSISSNPSEPIKPSAVPTPVAAPDEDGEPLSAEHSQEHDPANQRLVKKLKKTRWDWVEGDFPEDRDQPSVRNFKGLTDDQAQLALYRVRVKLLNRFVNNFHDYDGKAGRDDSPEPQYGADGKRTNTREKRVRDALKKEYQAIIADALTLVNQNAPEGLKITAKQRHEVRITIPIDKYPDYNFKGVLIGPRGMNMKRLEVETGCRIAVRGLGMRKRKDGINMPGDDLPLHVLLEAWDEQKLKQGIEIIKRVLIPVAPEEHQKQLRELAILNGTFREVSKDHCEACGKEGHTMYRCPNKSAGSWSAANVTCTRCGANTHVTRDCPVAGAVPGGHHQKLDSEYDDFMKEITGEDGRPTGGGPPTPGMPKPKNAGLGFSSGPPPGAVPPPSDQPMLRIGSSSLYRPPPPPPQQQPNGGPPRYPSALPPRQPGPPHGPLHDPRGPPRPHDPYAPHQPPHSQYSPYSKPSPLSSYPPTYPPPTFPGSAPPAPPATYPGPPPTWPPAPAAAPPSAAPWMSAPPQPPAPVTFGQNPYASASAPGTNPYAIDAPSSSAPPPTPPGLSNPYTAPNPYY